jgi:membrane protease YdiL (CAAX protease family)
MQKQKYPEPVEALSIILATFALLIILSVIYSVIVSSGLSAEAIDKNLRLFFIFGGSLFLIVPLTYASVRNYEIRELFRFRSVPLQILIMSVIAGLAFSILSDELDRLLSLVIPIPEWLSEQLEPLRANSFMDWFMIIFGAVIVASVAEEGLFRGFLQVTLEKKGDVTRAVILAAITWTLIHMNIYWAIQIFLMGIFIGYLAWLTDSIIPSIITHGLNNLLAVLFLNLDLEARLKWYTLGNHVSPVVLVIAAGTLYWSVREMVIFYRSL